MLLTGGIPLTLLMPGTKFFDVFGGINPQATYLFILILAVWVAFLFKIQVLLKNSFKYAGFTTFLLFAAISLLWTTDLLLGLRMLAKLLAPFAFYAAMLAFLQTEKDLKLAERVIYICCLVVLTLALVNTLSGGILSDSTEETLLLSHNILKAPYMSPANFAFLMSCAALLALGNYIETRKKGLLVLYVVFALAILWAISRIAIAGFILGTTICIFMLVKSRLLKVIIPLTLILAIFISFFTIDSFRSRMFFSTSSINFSTILTNPEKVRNSIDSSGRDYIWGEASKKFSGKNTLTGSGLGSVDAWLRANFGPVQLHSDYLRIFYDLGYVGLALYILALLLFFKSLFRAYRRTTNPYIKKYAAVAISVLALYSISLSTDNSLNYVTEFSLYVFSFIAFTFVAERYIARQVPIKTSSKRLYLRTPGHAI